jgi:hypothetical protein
MGQVFYKTIFLCQELLLLVALTTILSWYTPVHLPTDGRLAPTFFFTYEGILERSKRRVYGLGRAEGHQDRLVSKTRTSRISLLGLQRMGGGR